MVGNNGDRHNTYPLTLSVVVPSWPNQGRLVEWRREGGADVGIIVGAAAEEEDVAEEEEEEEGQELLWASNLVFSLSSSAILCSRLSQSLMDALWLPLHGHPGLYLHLRRKPKKSERNIQEEIRNFQEDKNQAEMQQVKNKNLKLCHQL